MKSIVAILMTMVSGGLAATDDGNGASIRFFNNDRMNGSLQALAADQLIWRSDHLKQPATLVLKKVLDVNLLPAEVPTSTGAEATLKLTNGDIVRGKLLSVSDQSVELETWIAGRMRFNRLMVTSLKIADQSALIYSGPDGLKGWKQPGSKPVWSYGRRAFLSAGAGAIGRDDLLPESCSVAFDLAWKGDALGFKLLCFAGTEVSPGGGNAGYEITFQRGSIYLRNCATSGFLGSAHAQVMMERDRARIEVRANVKTGTVCLLVNDRLLEVWSDPDAAKGKFGRGLYFISQNNNPLKISTIVVGQWDGDAGKLPQPRPGMGFRPFNLPGEPTPAPSQDKLPDGRMELANGDSIDGEVISIAQGLITIKTPLGDLQLPVSRLRNVALKKADLERCKRRNGDVRAGFADGSSLVFRMESANDGQLHGSSQNFENAVFKMPALSRLEFNIYAPELEDKRVAEEW